MKLKDVLEKTTQFFRDKGLSSARLDAEILLAYGLGIDRLRLYLDFDRPLTESDLAKCRELVKRRAQAEPVAHIVGFKDFYRSRFAVSSSVLIPRPETELLVEEAVAWSKNQEAETLRVVDLGTGSGCIGLSFINEIKNSRLLALDLSEEALAVARKNTESLSLGDRSILMKADAGKIEDRQKTMAEAGFEKVDLLLANPPYIAQNDSRVEDAVRRYEPATALFSPDEGLQDLKAWAECWLPVLAPGALVLMEMGLDQGPAMKAFFESKNEFSQVQILKDLAGHDRIVRGVKNG